MVSQKKHGIIIAVMDDTNNQWSLKDSQNQLILGCNDYCICDMCFEEHHLSHASNLDTWTQDKFM